MGELFSREWVEGFAERWNKTEDMVVPLGEAGFKAIIGFGLKGEDMPRVLIEVHNGKVERAGLATPTSPTADWDLRAEPEQWQLWRKQPLGLAGLGVAVTRGSLEFKTGDYRKMIRQIHLAKPFLHFFTLL